MERLRQLAQYYETKVRRMNQQQGHARGGGRGAAGQGERVVAGARGRGNADQGRGVADRGRGVADRGRGVAGPRSRDGRRGRRRNEN